MATTESWVLGGIDISAGNFQILELNADPPKSRPDWISASDSEYAALIRQPLHENRTITFKLRVAPQASMDTAFDTFGALIDKLRDASETSDGVALVWTPANSARTRTFDVLEGQVTELPITLEDQGRSWFLQRPIFTMELTCKPYWRGTEVTTSTAAASAPIVTLQVSSVPGDVPALGRLIVTDSATQNRRHVEWGLENQYYNSGAPAGLQINSGSLVTSGFGGASTAGAGSVNANMIRLAAVYAEPQAVAGVGNQPHVGTFVVRARVRASTTGVRVRLAWRSADDPLFRNAWATPPVVGTATTDWTDIDLGQITVPPVVSGTQRWTGQIEAYNTVEATAATLDIDYVLLIPAKEGYGKARGAYAYSPGVLTARDQFTGTTAGGNLGTRVAPLGGTWTTSGATGDFAFVDGPVAWGPVAGDEAVFRTVGSDTGFGRQAILGTQTPTDVEVGIDASAIYKDASYLRDMGPIARWVDANNFLWAYMKLPSNTAPAYLFCIDVVVAGTARRLKTLEFVPVQGGWRIRMVAWASGRVRAELIYLGAVVASMDVTDPVLATGGTLASGKVGFADRNTGATTGPRYYDNFYASTPSAEPIALYSTRTLEVRHNETLRPDSTNTYYGRPPSYRGTRFLVPTGTSRVVVKARRNDSEVAADTNATDSTTVQVAYTPRGLVVPR